MPQIDNPAMLVLIYIGSHVTLCNLKQIINSTTQRVKRSPLGIDLGLSGDNRASLYKKC